MDRPQNVPRDLAHRIHEAEHAIEDLVGEIASHAEVCHRLLSEDRAGHGQPHDRNPGHLAALQMTREILSLAADLSEQLTIYDRLSVRAGISPRQY